MEGQKETTLALDQNLSHVLSPLNDNPLHLIKRDLISAPVIEARCASGFVISHLLCDFELAAVAQIFRDAGRPE